MSALEWSLVNGQAPALDDNDSHLRELATLLLGSADFEAVLFSDEARHVFVESPELFSGLADSAHEESSNSHYLDIHSQMLRLIIAIALFDSFIQANWTGPDLAFTPLDLLPTVTTPISLEDLNTASLPYLTIQGETAYHLCSQPTLLLLSIRLFKSLSVQPKPLPTIPWWLLRIHLVHQSLLDEPAAFPSPTLAALRELAKTLPGDSDTLTRLHLEVGLLYHSVGHNKLANREFLLAARASGLEFELTGALGKKTKFQIEALSQLVLLAESRRRAGGDDEADHNGSFQKGVALTIVPEALALNDDTLLEETEFTKLTSASQAGLYRLSHLKMDPSSQPALHPLDQSLLLSLCLSQHNHSPTSGLTASQMMPYISRVLSHPRNWSIHTTALLLRARLESTRSRTVERSTLQLAALIEQMPASDSKAQERLRYFHQLPLLSKWEMERELAKRYLSLGLVRSALEIFTRLEMWEDAVGCLQRMEREDEAERIVRDLLSGRIVESQLVQESGRRKLSEPRKAKIEAAREAKLWCLLGDIALSSDAASKNPSGARAAAIKHYETAWDVSAHTSSRAMRSLGSLRFSEKAFEHAISCFKSALEINPLFARVWFTLGVSYVRLERWSEARDAFRKEVGVDEEDAEGWNNLAAVYLRLGEEGLSKGDVSGEDSLLILKLN